jgi:serine/threonine protein kinase
VHANLSDKTVFVNAANEPVLSEFQLAFREGSVPELLHKSFSDESPYVAPEARTPSNDLGPAIDIYAFGNMAMWFNDRLDCSPLTEHQCNLPNPLHRPCVESLVAFLHDDRFAEFLNSPETKAYASKFKAYDVREGTLSLFVMSQFTEVQKWNQTTALIQEPRTEKRFVMKTAVTRDDSLVFDLRRMKAPVFPSVCRYLAIDVAPDLSSDLVQIYLLRQYEWKGSLAKLLAAGTQLDLSKKHILVYGIAKGIEYLARHRFGHGNLCPANVLLSAVHEPIMIGFQLTERLPARPRSDLESQVYAAPEAPSGPSDDVYSLGMIMYALFVKFPPDQPAGSLQEPIRSGWRPDLRGAETGPQQYVRLIEQCWDIEPRQRPSFSDLVARLEGPDFTDDIDERKFRAYRDKLDRASP